MASIEYKNGYSRDYYKTAKPSAIFFLKSFTKKYFSGILRWINYDNNFPVCPMFERNTIL